MASMGLSKFSVAILAGDSVCARKQKSQGQEKQKGLYLSTPAYMVQLWVCIVQNYDNVRARNSPAPTAIVPRDIASHTRHIDKLEAFEGLWKEHIPDRVRKPAAAVHDQHSPRLRACAATLHCGGVVKAKAEGSILCKLCSLYKRMRRREDTDLAVN